MRHELSREEREIVELIAAGLTRWAIAERLQMSESTVREIIRKLCAYFDCPMRGLPDTLGISAPTDDFSFLPESET
jgi:DNA-binding CsgD family transcriptional regulator